MEKIDLKKECLEHLEGLLEKKIDENLVKFYPLKSRICIDDIDLFNEIAKTTNQNVMNLLFGGLFYNVTVPGENVNHSWNILLMWDKTKEFLRKYGIDYSVKLAPLKTNI